MSGLSVMLPLTQDDVFGTYALNTTFVEVVKQNFKMLVLTIPGEKMMDPNFGVGLRQYLFEQNNGSTYADITDRIKTQTAKYLPYVELNKIDFASPEGNPDLFPHNVAIRIHFTIVPLQVSTLLEIQSSN